MEEITSYQLVLLEDCNYTWKPQRTANDYSNTNNREAKQRED